MPLRLNKTAFYMLLLVVLGANPKLAHSFSFDTKDTITNLTKLDPDSILTKALFFDPSRWNAPFWVGTGGYGTARLDLFSMNIKKSTSTLGIDPFNYYGYELPFNSSPDSLGTRKTLITYHLGRKKEQHIDIDHRQHFRKGLSFGLMVGGNSTPGEFSRQLSAGRRFILYADFKDSSSRYELKASYRFFRLFNQENGGISSDSVFENASSLDTKTLPVFLDNSSIKFRQNQYDLEHAIYLIKPLTRKFDLSVYHHLEHVRTSFLFESRSPDEGYFSNFWVDSTTTYDSTYFSTMANELGVRMGSNLLDSRIIFQLGVSEEEVKYSTGSINLDTEKKNSLVIGAQLKNNKWIVSFSLIKSISGANNLWSSGLSVIYNGSKIGSFLLDAFSGTYEPSYFSRFYFSNHFKWNNDFNNEKRARLRFVHQIPKFALDYGFDFSTIDGFVFHKEDALPQQFGKQLAIGKIHVKKVFLYRKIGSELVLNYNLSGNPNVVDLPQLGGYASIFYKNLLFKKALDLRAGADLAYWSEFYSQGYMPATGVFFQQSIDKTGGFPVVGLFADLTIKSATITFRLDHLNAGMGDRNYYGAWRYPIQGRSLKIGIRWMLKD